MVRSKYTESTAVEPVDFTATAGIEQQLKSQLASHVGDIAYQKLEQHQDQKALEEGAEEGAKGVNAQAASEWTKAGRYFNQGVMKTLPLVYAQQVHDYTESEYAKVRQSGYTDEAWKSFQTKVEAHAVETRELTPAPFRAAVTHGVTSVLANYQASFYKTRTQTRVNQAQVDARTHMNLAANRLETDAYHFGYSQDPEKQYNDVRQALDYNYLNPNITAALKAKNNVEIPTRVTQGNLAYIIQHNIDAYNTAVDGKEPIENQQALLNNIEEIKKNPDKFVDTYLNRTREAHPLYSQLADRTKLVATVEKMSKQFLTGNMATSSLYKNKVENVQLLYDTNQPVSAAQHNHAWDLAGSLKNGAVIREHLNDSQNIQEQLQSSFGHPESMSDYQEKVLKQKLGYTKWGYKKAQASIDDYYKMRDEDPGAFSYRAFNQNAKVATQKYLTGMGVPPAVSENYYRLIGSKTGLSQIATGKSTVDVRVAQTINDAVTAAGKDAGIGNTYPMIHNQASLKDFAKTFANAPDQSSKLKMLERLKNAGVDVPLVMAVAPHVSPQDGLTVFASDMDGDNRNFVLGLTQDPKLTELGDDDVVAANTAVAQVMQDVTSAVGPKVAANIRKIYNGLVVCRASGGNCGTLDAGTGWLDEQNPHFWNLYEPGLKTPAGARIAINNILKGAGYTLLDDVVVDATPHNPNNSRETINLDVPKTRTYINRMLENPRENFHMPTITEPVSHWYNIPNPIAGDPGYEKWTNWQAYVAASHPYMKSDGPGRYKFVDANGYDLHYRRKDGTKGARAAGNWYELQKSLAQ